MTITAASIEANGWVLALTLTASLSSTSTTDSTGANFAGYALNPNAATPAMTLAMSSNGFAQSGGAAVASAVVGRSLVATKPLRLPTVATPAGVRSAKTPDETSLGGGSIKVRIALSEHVYFGDSGLTLIFAAGWRTGEPGGTIAVTNGSRIGSGDANMPPLPSPIVRWADVPYQRIGSTTLIPLEVVAFAHHPSGLSPIAGVKFTVTDGTNTATAWATALSSSPNYASGGTGVAARVYRAVVDGSTATPGPLGEGMVRGDYKAFPWIGQARSSDSGDTTLSTIAASQAPPMGTTLATDGLSAGSQVPFVVAYDPNGTWMPNFYVYVEPNTWNGTGSITGNVLSVATTNSGAVTVGAKISGVGVTAGCTVVAGSGSTWTVTATANVGSSGAPIALQGGGTDVWTNVTCSTSAAAAAAGTSGNNYTIARLAMGTLNRSIAARNGQPAIAAPCTDGLITRYRAGTYLNLGPGAVGSTNKIGITWDILEGDPADSNPRGNIVIATQTSFGGNTRATRCRFRSMTILGTPSTAAIPFSAANYNWVDNCEIRGPAGTPSNVTPIFPSYSTTDYWTNCKVWQIGTSISQSLARNCQVESTISSALVLNCARLSTSGGGSGIGVSIFDTQDRIIAGNDLRYIKGGSSWQASSTINANAGATALGTTYTVYNRQVFANNVCEQYGTSAPQFTDIGENNTVVATFIIVEGNTVAGDRTNFYYDDLNLPTIDLNDSESNIILCNRTANNAFDGHVTKHDSFNDPTVLAQRAGVALSATRNKSYPVGSQIVIAGSPANVYISTASTGNTASTGGPTGTGSAIVDGGVTWAWHATENRQHGYRPNAVRGWSALYGVGMVDNITLRGNPDPEFRHEFEGLNTPNLSVDGPAAPFAGDPKYTLDKSGTDTYAGTARLVPYDAANTGGGDYRPLAGSPLLSHSRSANTDQDIRGVTRAALFSAGAIEGPAAIAAIFRQRRSGFVGGGVRVGL